MKRIILALLLICSFAMALEGDYEYNSLGEEINEILWRNVQEACEVTPKGIRCLSENFQLGVLVKFQDNIYCYAETITDNPELVNVCYSTVSLTKKEIFELVYLTEGEIFTVEHFRENRTFYPGNYSVLLTPNAIKSINLAKCKVSLFEDFDFEFLEGESYKIYEYECDYLGKTKKVDLSVLSEEDFAIVFIQEDGLKGYIVYIVLGIIILVLVYYISKKRKGSQRIRRKRI